MPRILDARLLYVRAGDGCERQRELLQHHHRGGDDFLDFPRGPARASPRRATYLTLLQRLQQLNMRMICCKCMYMIICCMLSSKVVANEAGELNTPGTAQELEFAALEIL